MESKRPFKKGEATETASGETVLVNGQGTAYAATEPVLMIWDSFEGNTVEEVAEDIASAANSDPSELINGVNQVATQLEEADLLYS